VAEQDEINLGVGFLSGALFDDIKPLSERTNFFISPTRQTLTIMPAPVALWAPSTGSSLGAAPGQVADVGSLFILIGFISIFLTRPTLIFQGVSVSLILSQRAYFNFISLF
jgi:hypothetical protein